MGKLKRNLSEIFGATGMLIGILFASYSWATTVAPIPPIIKDWRYGVGFGILLFFVSALLFMWKYLRKFEWAESEIETIPRRIPNYINGNWIAQLEIKNLEESEITDCYATLEEANDIYFRDGTWNSSSLIPFLSNKPSRVVWDEGEESNEKCEITIPLKNSRHLNVMDMSGGIHYNFCGNKKLPPNMMLGTLVSTFRIRIDGKFNNKGMKPLYFNGYVRHRYKPFHFTSSDLDNKDDVIEGDRYLPYIIFGEGDWTKDEEVKKDIETERIEVEKWTEENKKRIEKINEEMSKKTKKKKSSPRKTS